LSDDQEKIRRSIAGPETVRRLKAGNHTKSSTVAKDFSDGEAYMSLRDMPDSEGCADR
jgi:hypothetical protein